MLEPKDLEYWKNERDRWWGEACRLAGEVQRWKDACSEEMKKVREWKASYGEIHAMFLKEQSDRLEAQRLAGKCES